MLKIAPRELFIALCVAMVAVLASTGAGSSRASDTFNLRDEQEIGQQVFEELKGKGEIVSSSPLYEPLRPIEAAITRTAQPYYGRPFKFYLVHEPSPNAFATPGGNVYVTDSLLYFVKNTEELAGTICHEVAHTIHHDSMALIEKERRIQRRETHRPKVHRQRSSPISSRPISSPSSTRVTKISTPFHRTQPLALTRRRS